MPANLTPQYMEAEAEYKKAQTAEERLACLRKMYALLPKHKASEKLQAELKTKISDPRDACEKEQAKGRKGGVSYKIPRQGAGQYVLPNDCSYFNLSSERQASDNSIACRRGSPA